MKFTETNIWCYSTDRQIFTDEFPTKKDAIEYVKENIGDGYVGRAVQIEFDEEDICYDETGYYLEQLLYDELGESAEMWWFSNEDELALSKILAKAVIDYLNKNHLQPDCCKVVDIEEVRLDNYEDDRDE